ncbi:hypothetical protein RhiirB3_452668 [Rhizophagus irregularis]|nr:hypothetical protein RhiirB3_452668 [Rhizophagus irregularis]
MKTSAEYKRVTVVFSARVNQLHFEGKDFVIRKREIAKLILAVVVVQNIPRDDTQKLPVKSTAFMDDTTIISDSKDKLEKLISMCHSFFKINNIQANIQKYELIKINAKEKDLNIEGVKIKKVNDEEGNRYLGFYFEYNNKRSIYKRKIKEIVDKAAKIMRFKMLTEKQVTAVWNMVVISQIEYQFCYLEMRNLQLKYWTSYCLGEHGEVLTLGNNSYLVSKRKILKWKAQGSSIKGKSPKWYERLIELTTDKDGSRNLSRKYVNMNKNWSFRKQINLYDEEKDIGKNQLITWNDNNNDIVFGKYKKKSKSKNFKKIGVHWIIENMSNMDDSPNLIKCSGCEKNISKGSKAMQYNECWIYLDNNSGARKKIYVDDTSLCNRNVEFIDQFVDGEKFTSGDDNALRSYKIKNLLKILPTYTILFERNCGHILTDVCLRCESEVEDWEHIWICDDNDKSEYEILLDTFITTEEKLKDLDKEKYKSRERNGKFFKYSIQYINNRKSITNYGIRELTKGIFNNELYKLCNSKQERQLLEEIWENCYLNIRSGIWLQRCEKANEIDKRKGVTKNDKKRKRLTSGIDEVETNTLDEERGKNNNNNHKKKPTKS